MNPEVQTLSNTTADAFLHTQAKNKTDTKKLAREKAQQKWNSYKQTMKRNVTIFDLARDGRVDDLKSAVQMILEESNYECLEDNSFEASLNEKNKRGHSPLMLAIYNNQLTMAEYLIDMGADVNSRDFNSNSILMGAAFKGNIAAIDLLVTNGAQIDLRNSADMSALDWARLFGRKEAILKLKELSTSEEQPTLSSRLSMGFRLFKSALFAR